MPQPGRHRREPERVLHPPHRRRHRCPTARGRRRVRPARPAGARTPIPRPAGSAAAPAWRQPPAAAVASGASAGRPAPAAKLPRRRAYPDPRRRRARSGAKPAARADWASERADSAQIRTGSARRMPARRRERLGHADVQALLRVAHRRKQLVLGLELDVADRQRTHAYAGRALDRHAVRERVDAFEPGRRHGIDVDRHHAAAWPCAAGPCRGSGCRRGPRPGSPRPRR